MMLCVVDMRIVMRAVEMTTMMCVADASMEGCARVTLRVVIGCWITSLDVVSFNKGAGTHQNGNTTTDNHGNRCSNSDNIIT